VGVVFFVGIFKAYDVRGIYPDEINEDNAYQIALAFGGPNESVVLGRDWRKGSEELYKAFLDGLMDAGSTVYALGDVPTPLVSFAVRVTGASRGAMITASHNPPQYNGVKFFGPGGYSYTPEELRALEAKVPSAGASEEDGYVIDIDIWEKYAAMLPNARNVRMAFDAGNGVGTKYINVFKRFFDVFAINTRKDPDFSARGPEPTEENVQTLVDIVRDKECAFGLAVDGDGDRAFFVGRDGPLNPAFLFVLFGRWFLERGKNIFIATVDLSRRIEEYLPEARIYRVRVGTSYIVEMAKKVGAHFSGEYSRHYAAYEFSGHSDPAFFSAVLTHFVPLDRWAHRFTFPPLLSKSIRVKDKNAAVQAVAAVAEQVLSTVDGVEFMYKNHRVLVRPSNTEEKIRIYVEGDHAGKVLEELSKLVPNPV